MGCSISKHDEGAIFLCKERIRFIKQAIDSRYALSAAQLSYTQSLHSIGTSLRKFAEFETVNESSLSTSEPDKSPSHSSYASPSPSRALEHIGSPRHSGSPLSPRLSNTSYMHAGVSMPLKFTVDTPSSHYIEEDSLTFPLPPPPPPPELGFSWDFFNPVDAQGNAGSTNGNVPSGINHNFSRLVGLKEGVDSPVKNEGGILGDCPPIIENSLEGSGDSGDVSMKPEQSNANCSVETLARIASNRENADMEKDLCTEREDASKFITHRAKDFVSSMKDIEHRFTRAGESGHEVARMLETNKIRLSISCETIGKSYGTVLLSALHMNNCCNAGNVADNDAAQQVKQVIWNRSISSRSSSSRIPLTSASRDDGAESGSDFIEEFCMISGSHSSTLDRLYAWERKLYDEVKASESIRKAYDQKCTQLRHQFARDMKAQVIDKTRAAVKDLHSQLTIAIQAVDSISKRIEKLRDEEMQPQLLELIQGLVRMWKAMLECHQTQYITISLAYHLKNSTSMPQSESYRQAITNVQTELKCFASCFSNWVTAQKSYVEAVSSWLEKCILPSQERSSWGRKLPFCPRRALAPPIFVLSKELLAGINNLPSSEVCNAVNIVVSNLSDLVEKPNEEEKVDKNANMETLRTSLAKMFDQLGKFSESSVKVYEKVKQGSDAAHDAYTTGRYN